jgi:hypothetical protein
MQGDHLLFNGVRLSANQTRRFNHSPARRFRLTSIAALVCFCFVASQHAWSQDAAGFSDPVPSGESSSVANVLSPEQFNFESTEIPSPWHPLLAEMNAPPAITEFALPHGSEARSDGQVREVTQETPMSRPEQELIVEGLVSYGNYRIFASGYDEKLYTAGLEYDRHSWGYFLKAQVDYVAEFLPFVLLNKPRSTDIFGNPVPYKERNIREYVPGIGIAPIGFRLQWRSKKAIRPYLEAKGGMLGFTKKVPSTEASYENFSLQSSTGVQVKLSDRWGLRLGLFGDFHFSNGFVVPVDPGLDVMNASLGVSYHF